MIPEESLGMILDKLESCAIPYMIVGSFAGNLHGVPRTTHDADLVVELDESALNIFASSLDRDFYFDLPVAQQALRSKFLFSSIHIPSGFKVDFIVRKDRPFSKSEFQRRIRADFLNRKCWFATAEDTILAKLEWSKKGESERQYRDAVNISRVQPDLDWTYLRHFAVELGVEDLLARLGDETP